jgi:hypothetical protein
MNAKEKLEVKELCAAFDDIIYMAIRYANNRHTYAPSIVRYACETRAKFDKMRKFNLKEDTTLEAPESNTRGIVCEGDNLLDLIEKYKRR